MTQNAKNTPKNNKKQFNYTKWGFLLGTPIAIAAFIATTVTVPEFRCAIGWKSDVCVTQQKEQKEVALIAQAETGEFLSGVRIQVISNGVPEVRETDNNGFAKILIPKKAEVVVNLSKQGYPTKDITIDPANEQNTTRIVRFSKSGVLEAKVIVDENTKSPEKPKGDNINSQTPTSANLGSSSGAFPPKYVGQWVANLTSTNQDNGSSKDIRANVNFKNGKLGSKVGDIGYGNCNSSLILRNVKPDSIELFENITAGNCISNGIITIKLTGDDIVEYKWTKPGSSATTVGVLTRE